MKKYLNFLLLALLLTIPNLIFSGVAKQQVVQVNLVQEAQTIQPGQPFWVAIHFKIDKDWHVYWKNPGDVGVPVSFKWQLPTGFEAGPIQWPCPEKFITSDMIGFGYAEEVVFLSQIMPPQNLQEGTQHQISVQTDWLVCSATMCQPGSAESELLVHVSNENPIHSEHSTTFFKNAHEKMPVNNPDISIKSSKGFVQLEIPADDKTISEAYFFAEEPDVLDYSYEPQVTLSSDSKQTYFLHLKEKTPLKTLNGILVTHTERDQKKSTEAFEIHQAIEEEAAGLVGFVDVKKMGLASVTKSEEANGVHDFEGGLGLALFLAFIGGMILNLMPCVLPIISLKVMSFVKMAGQKRSLTIKHGLWFSLGVLISFWVLVAAIFILRAYGQVVGWGFQLQEPIFVVVLASLFFVFALSLFGIFEWGLIFSSWAGQTQSDTQQQAPDSFVGSFFSGILATAVATPCTGPFLGSALGYALTLPAFEALLVFTSLGLGMCSPYLLLSAFPKLLRFVPKPGAWMETFKQMTGFILLAAVVWLMWVFSAQTNSFSLICLTAGFLCFAIGAWIYGRGGVPSASKTKRIISYCMVVLCFFAGFQVIVLPRATWATSLETAADNHTGWENFSAERVAELRAQGTPVLIDFTAKWCLICQVNHFVLASAEVESKLNQMGVVKMKADWTKNDPAITEELSKFGRNSVPLYVVYGNEKEQEPVIMPQVLTPDIVASHLDQVIKQNIAMEL